MKTMGDAVLEHVKQYQENKITGTREAILAMELPDDQKYNIAGNYYLAALAIISGLQKEIDDLYDANIKG